MVERDRPKLNLGKLRRGLEAAEEAKRRARAEEEQEVVKEPHQEEVQKESKVNEVVEGALGEQKRRSEEQISHLQRQIDERPNQESSEQVQEIEKQLAAARNEVQRANAAMETARKLANATIPDTAESPSKRAAARQELREAIAQATVPAQVEPRVELPAHPGAEYGAARRAYVEWFKALRQMEAAMPEDVAQVEQGQVIESKDPESPPAVARMAGQFQGALSRFNSPAFVEQFSQIAKDDLDDKKELKRILSAISTLEKKIQNLPPNDQSKLYEEFRASALSGEGLDKLLAGKGSKKTGNPFAEAGVAITTTNFFKNMEGLTADVAGLERVEPIDIYAKDEAKFAGPIHHRIRGVMALDFLFAGLAGSSAYSGTVKMLAASIAQLPQTVQSKLIDTLGVQGLNVSTKLLTGILAGSIAYMFVANVKDPMREEAKEHPDKNVIKSVSTKQGMRLLRGMVAGAYLASSASHGLSGSIIGGKLWADYGEKAVTAFASENKVLTSADTTIGNVPKNIELFFKTYLNVEEKGAAKKYDGFTPEEIAAADQMKWSFTPPVKIGAGPINAAKKYFIFRTEDPKLTPADKKAMDEELIKLGVPTDKGFAWFAAELARSEMQTPREKLSGANKGLQDEIEHLKTTGPVAHFLWELTVIFSKSGQEVPNLLTALKTAKDRFATAYGGFTTKTWQERVQNPFSAAMPRINSKADTLNMNFPAINLGGSVALPKLPEITPYPFLYSDAEWKILGEVYGVDFNDPKDSIGGYNYKRLAYNSLIALLYGGIDIATVRPSITYTRKRERFFERAEGPGQKSLEEAENVLSAAISEFLNQAVRPSVQMLTGVSLPSPSVTSLRAKLHELAGEEVAALRPAEKQNVAKRAQMRLARMFQMPIRETVEQQVARANWFNEQIDGIGNEKRGPDTLANLMRKLYPDFGEYFDTMQSIRDNPKNLDDVSSTFIGKIRKSVERANRRILAEERVFESSKIAQVEMILDKLYADAGVGILTQRPDVIATEEQYKSRPVAIKMDGTSRIAIPNNEAQYFFATAELERVRANALNRLYEIVSTDPSPDARRWIFEVQKPDYLEKLRVRVVNTPTKEARTLIESAKKELGEPAVELIRDYERMVQHRTTGLLSDAINPDDIAKQLSEVNIQAVGAIKTRIESDDPANPARRTGKRYAPAFTYEFNEKLGRPTLHIHLYDEERQVNIATTAYPGYVPNLTLDSNATLIKHIVDWYQIVGENELALRALTQESTDSVEEVLERIGARNAWPNLEIDLSKASPDYTSDDLAQFARLNALNELTVRERNAMSSISLRRPASPQQLEAFDASQMVLVGGSAVPESARRLEVLFADIRRHLQNISRKSGQERPNVKYQIASGELTIQVPGEEEVRVAVQAVARARDILPLS